MKCAIYARKSQDDGGDSTTRQIEHAQAYAEKKGWTISPEHIYVDDNVSGAVFDRPGLIRLIDTLTPSPPYQALVVSEVSRLGREILETGFILKQLSVAGVKTVCYLRDEELRMDDPTQKVLLSVSNYASEIERERARERTRDALLRKAKLGHVTGGKVFGYHNKAVFAPDGQRSHVERVIHEPEAEVVREIFQLYAAGKGFTKIAKFLNERGVQAPPPRGKGRLQAWAPTTIREMLNRDLYQGEIVWNKIRKRDQWGKKKYESRPESEWVHTPAPGLRIISEELWKSTRERLTTNRNEYLRHNNGQLQGRPTRGVESQYLLTGMAQCGTCSGSIIVSTHGSTGKKRVAVYKCGVCHKKGKTVCSNNLAVPLALTDQAVLAAIEEQVLQPGVVEAAIEQALEKLRPLPNTAKRDSLAADLAIVEAEAEHLTQAIAQGGDIPSLVAAIKEREKRLAHFEAELRGLEQLEMIADLDLDTIRDKLREQLQDWQGLLRRHTPQARQILRKLLVGRLVFTPHEDEGGRYYLITGQCAGGKLVEGVVYKSTATGKTRWGHHPLGQTIPSKTHATETLPGIGRPIGQIVSRPESLERLARKDQSPPRAKAENFR